MWNMLLEGLSKIMSFKQMFKHCHTSGGTNFKGQIIPHMWIRIVETLIAKIEFFKSFFKQMFVTRS